MRLFSMLSMLAASLALLAACSSEPASDKALEASLLAPCCWNGTLETHDSDVAHDLRNEIETRYHNGESTRAIEADLVARYGPQIRAMPSPRAFLGTVGAASLAVLAALVLLARKWRARASEPTPPVPRGRRDDYDDRIDAELANLDG